MCDQVSQRLASSSLSLVKADVVRDAQLVPVLRGRSIEEEFIMVS